jgi:hypothetical protein
LEEENAGHPSFFLLFFLIPLPFLHTDKTV